MGRAGSIRMGGVFVEIGADAKAFFATVGAVDKRLSKLGSFGVGAGLSGMFKAFDGIAKSVTKVGQSMSVLGTRMAAFGTVAAAPVALAVKQFASFDDAIRATAAVTGSLGPEGAAAFAMLNEKARDLGATTSFTAVEVANLMTELGRAGFKPDEINNMTAAVLDLSRATGTNATRSAGIMAATLRQFELGAEDATRAADILTYTANNTFNTVDSLGESLKYAGPVAKSLGMSLEDTAAILGVLGNVGIQGSEAGTALRRLSVISSGAGAKLQDLFGVSNTDAAGNLKPLVQILDEINQATMDMPVAERTARMAKAFGLLGITSANVLSKSAGGVQKLADGLKTADGTAMKTAKAMDAGLGGSVRIALSAIEGTQLALGDALAPALMVVIGFIEDLATGITGFVKTNQQMVVDVAKGTVAVIGCGLAFYALGTAIAVAGGALGALLSPLGLVAAGIAAMVVTTPELKDSFVSTFGEVQSIASTTIKGIYDAITGGDLGGALEIAMTGLMAAWLKGTGELQAAFAEWWAKFQNGFTDVGTALAVVAESSGLSDLATSPQAWGGAPDHTKGRAATPEELKQLADQKNRNIAAMEAASVETQNGRTSAATDFRNRLKKQELDATAKLASLVSTARDRRILSGQGDEVINAVGEAKTMDELRALADEFFALRDTGMLTETQQKKYGEAVSIASERVTPTATSGVVEQSPGGITPPDQDALLKAAAEAAKQVETQGTFSSVNLGGMGFGSTIAERQLKALEAIQKNTEEIGDEGAVTA
ncbi:MAG: phage tail tape measure protein [Caulobacteraceae bacterium]|nr:phage tail tape measure protein [Caulobacteraceae bacterium]